MAVQPDSISGYHIAGELGKGSMGVVYKAVPKDGGDPVAIKVYFPDAQLAKDEASVLLERFQREGNALAQINHRNVVRVKETGSENDLHYIVMEMLTGHNLKELLTLGTRFSLADTFDVMLQLLAGLDVCHRAGLVHRDIKPANVVRAPDGIIKLTDFGIARVVTDQTLARSGTIVGTPNYMSPEQIRGEDVDARTDLFSAGVLMYELLTGKKPFDGPDMTAIMYNVTNIHPPSPRFYNGALPEEIEELAFVSLAKDVSQRFSTASDFTIAVRELDQALRYRDDADELLNALPAAPDPDADAGAAFIQGGIASTANNAGSSSALASASSTGSVSLSGGGGIVSGTVYCLDCGMANDEQSDFCVRCMRPLIKRQMLDQLAAKKARVLFAVGRGDYVFLTCLSVVIVATVLMILYIFFRGVT